MACLFSKIVFKIFTRRVSLILMNFIICVCFFFLIILKDNIQTHYAVTISSRAGLQILNNVLTISTLEQFPTENRGLANGLCVSIGMLGGVSLPFFNELNT